MTKKKKYLTIQEELELAKQGINHSPYIGHSKDRNSFIVKIRSIWNGNLRNKRIKL